MQCTFHSFLFDYTNNIRQMKCTFYDAADSGKLVFSTSVPSHFEFFSVSIRLTVPSDPGTLPSLYHCSHIVPMKASEQKFPL
jgi:hypothetical protein